MLTSTWEMYRAPRAARRRTRVRRHAHALPRPRRHGGPRRRPDAPRDHVAAAGRVRRRDPDHRAGRGAELEVRRPVLAERNLSLMVAAALDALGGLDSRRSRRLARWERVPRRAVRPTRSRSTASRVAENPDILPYFQQATPVGELEHARIGSRPRGAARAAGSTTCARSLGLRLDAEPPRAARVVRRRPRLRALRGARRGAAALLAEMMREFPSSTT
jgi:phosphoenolpyruvate carboxylase